MGVDPPGQAHSWSRHPWPVLQVVLDHPLAQLPTKAYDGDAGWDLYCCEKTVIPSGGFADVPLGFSMAVPDGYFGLIFGRSSTYRKRRLRVDSNVIDCGYRGPMFAGVHNMAEHEVTVRESERISQLLILPVPHLPIQSVQSLPDSHRGEKGFGSSGR